MDPMTSSSEPLADPKARGLREELVAADLSQWKTSGINAGTAAEGPIKKGMGLSIHTGRRLGHASTCEIAINADGSVEAKLGSQDLGTGTRTVIGIVIAETSGPYPLER
jgi:xanthine dehydrogenase YagR molybdenum-binding subunit